MGKTYTAHSWKEKEVITPGLLNYIQDGIQKLSDEIDNATSHYLDDDDNHENKRLSDRLDQMISISEKTPTKNSYTSLWINPKAEQEEYQILVLNDLMKDPQSAKYTENQTYKAGNYVIYNEKIYRCKENIQHSEGWAYDQDKFQRIYLMDQLDKMNEFAAAMSDAPINLVRYDAQQLEEEEQAQARSNIGAISDQEVDAKITAKLGSAEADFIRYNVNNQGLEESQKKNARDNIGAASKNQVVGVIKYNQNMTELTPADQEMARKNIDAVSSSEVTQQITNALGTDTSFVKYTQQTLQPTQQAQVRANIGAIAAGDAITEISSSVGSITVTKGIGSGRTTDNIEVIGELAFDSGFISKNSETGNMELHLTKNNAELDNGIYTPIPLVDQNGASIGGGLAFDGGLCEKRTAIDATGQEREAYFLVLTRGTDRTPLPESEYTPIQIVGGGGGNLVTGAGFKFSNKSKLATSIVYGQDVIVSIDVAPRGQQVDITARWYVDGVWVSSADQTGYYTEDENGKILPNTFSFNAKSYFAANKRNVINRNQTIKLELLGSDGSTQSTSWNTYVMEVAISWDNLDSVVIYDNESNDLILPIQITAPSGQYQLIATDVYVATSSSIPAVAVDKSRAGNITANLTVPRSYLYNKYGKHMITVHLSPSEGLNYESNEISIIVLNEAQFTPVIVLFSEQTTLEQYETARIQYYIYDNNTSANIQLSLTYNDDNKEKLDAVLEQNQTRRTGMLHEFTYTFFSAHPSGANFRVTYLDKNLYDEITLTVTQSDKVLTYVTTTNNNLKYNLDPRGWTNQALDRESFGSDNNGSAQFNNFNWIKGGFIEDREVTTNDNGQVTEIYNQGAAFVIKRGSTFILPRSLFSDSDTNGKTINLSFKIKNSADYNALVLDNAQNDKGIKLFANKAEIYLNSNIPRTIYYAENTRIDLAIHVQKQGTYGRVVTLWLAGVPAGVYEYNIDGTLVQEEQPAIIGSTDCDIYLYSLRVYDIALTKQQMVQNFIADGGNITEKLNREERNANLFTSDGESIIEDELINKKTITVVHIQASEMPRDKTTSKPAHVTIYDNGIASLILNDDNTKFVVQGTSSTAYERSSLNLDIDFRKNPEGKTYQISEESIPVNYLNIKVNVASSENANNVCAVDWYNKYQPFMTEAKAASLNTDGSYKKGQAIRDTIEGKPCAVFIKNTNTPDPNNPEAGVFWAGSQKVYPQSTILYAMGDICNSKKNKKVFGQNLPEGIAHPTKACIEIGGNDHILQQMLMSTDIYDILINDQFSTYPLQKDEPFIQVTNEEGETEEQINEDYAGWYNQASNNQKHYPYEWRMAPSGTKEQITAIEDSWINAMKWVGNLAEGHLVPVRTYTDANEQSYIQEGDAITNFEDSDSVYSYKYVLDRYVFTKKDDETNASYQSRLNILKTQFKEKFQLNSLLYHFLMIEFFAAYDDVSKNTFYSLDYDPADGIYKWNIKAAYDWDTILGCDNDGIPLGGYGIDFEEVYGNDDSYFNANINPLWNFIRIAFHQELSELYGQKRGDAFNANNIKNKWNNYQIKRPQATMIHDAYVKYILPYKTTNVVFGADPPQGPTTFYLNRLQGNKRYQRDQFLTYQAYYMDGKYGSVAKASALLFRTNGAVSRSFTFSPYTTTYITIIADNDVKFSEKMKTNDTVTRSFSWSGSNTPIYVQPAPLIKRFESFSDMNVGSLDANAATKLLTLKLNEDNVTSNQRWTTTSTLAVQSPVLKQINVENLASYSEDLNLISKQAEALQILDTRKTQCSGIRIVPYSNIKTLRLNACSKLYMQYNTQVEQLSFDDIGNNEGLTELYIINCNSAVTNGIKNYLQQSLNKTLPEGKYRNIKITNINWQVNDITLLNQLYKQKGFNDDGIADNKIDCELTGSVYINGTLLSTDKAKFNERWKSLTIEAKNEIQICTIQLRHWQTNELLASDQNIQKGTEIDSQTLNALLTEANKFKIKTNNYIYSNPTYPDAAFNEYGKRAIQNEKVTFTVQYTKEIRYYTVTWKVAGQQDYVKSDATYGQELIYENETGRTDPTTQTFIPGKLPEPRSDSNNYYLFKGWDNSTGYITEDTIVTAQWISSTKTISQTTDGFVDGNGTIILFKDLNAANFYALAQMDETSRREALYGKNASQETITTLENKYLTSNIKIPLGYDYNYNNITSSILLDTESPANENLPQIIEKTISFNDPFTLSIHFSIDQTPTGTTIFSLNDEGKTIITFRKIASRTCNLLYQGINIGSFNLNSAGTKQDTYCIVLTNNPLLNTLTIYWPDNGISLDSSQRTEKTDQVYATTLKQKQLQLMFGAEYSSVLTNSYINIASNMKNLYAKYWNNLLGSTQCVNLALLAPIEMNFRYAGYKVHSYIMNRSVQYYTLFSFAAQKFLTYTNIVLQKDFFNYLPKFSSFYKKIFPLSWQQLLTPINNYQSPKLSTDSGSDPLVVYAPMYANSKTYLYPEYRGTLSSLSTRSQAINSWVNDNFSPLTWSGNILTGDSGASGHAISTNMSLHDGDIVKCGQTACSVIVCTATTLNALPETIRAKFSFNTSVNGITCNNPNIAIASTAGINAQIHNESSNTGAQTGVLIWFWANQPQETDTGRFRTAYQGGTISSYTSNTTSNNTVNLSPLLCFSIGKEVISI